MNLIIIGFTMYAMRFGVLQTVAQGFEGSLTLQIPEWQFFLLVLVMVLLAAGGNIINDYFDQRIDEINKPKKVVVGKVIRRGTALRLHQTFTLSATILGIYLAYDFGMVWWSLLPIAMGITLWFYSYALQRYLWIGNFAVSLLVGIVPLWSGLFEIPLLVDEIQVLGGDGKALSQTCWIWLIGFALFAFWLTLIREAIKDIQDKRGDITAGFRTLPIVWGIAKTKWYLHFLFLVFILSIPWITWRLHPMMLGSDFQWLFSTGILVLVLVPMIIAWRKILLGVHPGHFAQGSFFLKAAMAGGILIGMFMPFWYP
ncbi:MAG: UbiA family prenyltransferase [Flavobacteriales bacterium]|nr:UbiA family prenyltransferase [Flavobacteriales bacterium]